MTVILYKQSKKEKNYTYYDGDYRIVKKFTEIPNPKLKATSKDLKTEFEEYNQQIQQAIKDTDCLIREDGLFANIDRLFNHFNKCKTKFQKIQEHEMQYLLNCGSGVRYDANYTDKLYKYDIRSFYPYLLQTKILKVPYSEPEIVDTVDLDQYLDVGIYNVKIECDDPKKFTLLESNMYTHYEVNFAKRNGLKIKQIGPHAIYKKFVTGYDLFYDYVHYLYNLKTTKDNKIYKKLLNLLWGKLCASTKYNKIVINEDELKHTKRLKQTIDLGNGDVECLFENGNKRFKTNYARLKPFILGQGRIHMHTRINKYRKYVKFVNTDCIYTTKFIPEFNRNNKLGFFKYEGTTQ